MSDVRHVATGRDDQKDIAWCGETGLLMVRHFVDPTHVLLDLQQGTLVTPCKACLKAMRAAIDVEVGCDCGDPLCEEHLP